MRELLEQGKGVNEVARLLGIDPATVCYHKRKLGFSKDPRFSRRYDWASIQSYYDAGHSVRDCMQHFGFSSAAWSDAVKRGAVVARPQAMPLAELLIKHPRSRNDVKFRLIAAGLKDDRCETCGISEWQAKPLSLALHHRNGDPHDNRLQNLTLLCPNCHSQTPNFAAKNAARLSRQSLCRPAPCP